jgi:hypothetical protein
MMSQQQIEEAQERRRLHKASGLCMAGFIDEECSEPAIPSDTAESFCATHLARVHAGYRANEEQCSHPGCNCKKFNHYAYTPGSECTFSYSAPRADPGKLTSVRAWYALWEAGWSVQKIADAWGRPFGEVDEALNKFSQQPLPLPRSMPRLPETEEECTKHRQHLRALYNTGWSLESLHRVTGGIYAPEFLVHLVGADKATRKSRATLDPRRLCPCPCKKRLHGRQRYASDACRAKIYRDRKRSAKVAACSSKN